ncbi:unnamed protein product [Candida verbasci]|uniref:Altered inheritance of mitochondria protein 36, mitochondrial n=1 Tax=Candida verbasci TaxID=1227364 RepID=A0A9W4XBY5_9ASCO|nr:unnamed protein product [Candida verbasci]
MFKSILPKLQTRQIWTNRLKHKGFNVAGFRFYSTPRISPKKEEHRVRYILYMVALSWVAMYFVGNNLEKKRPSMQNLTEREFNEYELKTGIKRRNKLINDKLAQKYKFYVIPYIKQDEELDEIVTKLKQKDSSYNIKVIDPKQLIEEEKADDSRKYSILLQTLESQKKSFPPGLITAIIKDYLNTFINTREGTFDTNFIIKNYPQTTNEAIKFENDVSDICKCLILHYDIINELPKVKNDEEVRDIKNVDGYFNTIGKSKTIVSKWDEMDTKLEEIMLEDY